jgi:hypothetical protein
VYNKNLFSQDISKHGMLILFWIIWKHCRL